MESKRMMNRLKKFDSDHNNKECDSKNKLTLAREETILRNRKQKIDEQIMKHRMINYLKTANVNANKEKFSHLIYTLDELIPFIPQNFDEEFNIFDDKLDKIKEFLDHYVKEFESNNNTSNNNFNENIISNNSFIINQNEAFIRYAIIKLRDISMTMDEYESSQIDNNLINNLIKILFHTEDIRVQYEITHIIINLTHDSKEFTDFMIEEELLKKLYSMLLIKEPGIVYHVIWIFAHLADNEELKNIILTILPDLPERLNHLILQFSNVFMHSELLKNLTWLIYRLFRFSDEHFINKIVDSIPVLINFFVEEVNNIIILNENNKNNLESLNLDKNSVFTFQIISNPLIDNLLLIFYKITQLVTDEEILSKFFNNNFLTKLMILFPDPILVESYNIIHTFRIIGGLLSSSNHHDVDKILNYGYITKVEKMLEVFMLNNTQFSEGGFIINHNFTEDIKILSAIGFGVANITAGSQDQISKVILKSKLPIYFLKIGETVKSNNYRKEVLYIFYNAFDYGDIESIQTFIINNFELQKFLIENLNNNLEDDRKDSIALIQLTLDFIKLMLDNTKNFIDLDLYKFIKRKLQSLNIAEILDKLSYNKSREVADLAELILYDNWTYAEENDLMYN